MPKDLDLGPPECSRPEKTVSSRMHLIFYWDSSSSVGPFFALIGFGVPQHHPTVHSVLLAEFPQPRKAESRSRNMNADKVAPVFSGMTTLRSARRSIRRDK